MLFPSCSHTSKGCSASAAPLETASHIEISQGNDSKQWVASWLRSAITAGSEWEPGGRAECCPPPWSWAQRGDISTWDLVAIARAAASVSSCHPAPPAAARPKPAAELPERSQEQELGTFHKLRQDKNSPGAGVFKATAACEPQPVLSTARNHPRHPPHLEAADVHQFAEEKTQNSAYSSPAALIPAVMQQDK